jgi:hypothetical protein
LATIYLKKGYGYEGILATNLSSMIFIGMCVESPILSFIADKIKSYLCTVVSSAILMALLSQRLGILFYGAKIGSCLNPRIKFREFELGDMVLA